MKHINDIFDNLDKWRHLPAYQLERRADIFFSIYLPDLIFSKLGIIIDEVIPEFPIRIGTINRKQNINKSFKVDYLAKEKNKNTVVFIELKTDEGSRRDKQDQYLERAKQVGLIELLEGIRKIYLATKSKKKYQHLLDRLQNVDLITTDNGGIFTINQADYHIEIVYIMPINPKGLENVITFREAAEIIKRHEDDLSLRFSKSLLRWAEVQAGEERIATQN